MAGAIKQAIALASWSSGVNCQQCNLTSARGSRRQSKRRVLILLASDKFSSTQRDTRGELCLLCRMSTIETAKVLRHVATGIPL